MKKEPFNKNLSLKDQLDRSSGSVMDNIAEGFERESRNEFVHHLTISKGSAGEARSQLYRAKDRNYLDENIFNKLLSEIEDVSKQLKGLINYIKKSTYKGVKYKDRQANEPSVDYSSIQILLDEKFEE